MVDVWWWLGWDPVTVTAVKEGVKQILVPIFFSLGIFNRGLGPEGLGFESRRELGGRQVGDPFAPVHFFSKLSSVLPNDRQRFGGRRRHRLKNNVAAHQSTT